MRLLAWLKRTPVSHTEGAGKVIGDAPDPSASYLPENRPIDLDKARELRRMVTGR